MDMSHTTEVMGILGDFYFGCRGNLCSSIAVRDVFFQLADHENPLLPISNQILVISHRDAFVAILVPKWLPW